MQVPSQEQVNGGAAWQAQPQYYMMNGGAILIAQQPQPVMAPPPGMTGFPPQVAAPPPVSFPGAQGPGIPQLEQSKGLVSDLCKIIQKQSQEIANLVQTQSAGAGSVVKHVAPPTSTAAVPAPANPSDSIEYEATVRFLLEHRTECSAQTATQPILPCAFVCVRSCAFVCFSALTAFVRRRRSFRRPQAAAQPRVLVRARGAMRALHHGESDLPVPMRAPSPLHGAPCLLALRGTHPAPPPLLSPPLPRPGVRPDT